MVVALGLNDANGPLLQSEHNQKQVCSVVTGEGKLKCTTAGSSCIGGVVQEEVANDRSAWPATVQRF